jgi:simple sugar transport system substrate-binding protein
LALGPTSAHPTLKALEKSGQKGKLWFATFDLSDEISRGIKDGSIQFGIDQQPYLQAYIPLAVLVSLKNNPKADAKALQGVIQSNAKTKARFDEYGVTPAYGARHIGSGPGFVTKDNISKVEKFAGQFR